MDTDSFIFEIIGESFGDIMLENKKYFDLSNFLKDSKYYCGENKKVPGKMKDEYAGKNIDELIATKPKSYIIITEDNQKKCAHKGRSYNFTSNEYRNALNNKETYKHSMRKNNIYRT